MYHIDQDKQRVELYLSCRGLKDKDIISKSDPYVKVSLGKQSDPLVLIGQTEVIKDNLNPNFSKTITVDYVFEVRQPIKFEVWDWDSPTKSEFLGSIESTVGAIVGARNQTLVLDLKDRNSKNGGKIIVRAEKIGTCRESILWQWTGVSLMNTRWLCSKSSPFLRFFKRRENEWLKVHETEVVRSNLNPIWKLFTITGDKLYGGDHLRPIRVECWDWNHSGKCVYIGETEFNLNDIIQGKLSLDLFNTKKGKKRSGLLKINGFKIEEKPEFIDFLVGGEQLSVTVAIDFTSSNGNPAQSTSLHAFRPDGLLNEYQRTTQAVCDILLNYDWDKQVPVYGFGGKPHFPTLDSPSTLHCFPCTGDPNQANVYGLSGIMNAYSYALKHIELSGPTLFAPLIRETMKVAQFNKQNGIDVYTILLILTDGEIHDMRETTDLIVQASELPLSIIIVGVGNNDFGNMQTLDGDDGLYDGNGKKATRDIVQFVPFKKFSGNQERLAQEVLAEIPEQLVKYMAMVGRKPNPPQIVDLATMMKPLGENPQLMTIGTTFVQNTIIKKGQIISPGDAHIMMQPEPRMNVELNTQLSMSKYILPNNSGIPEQNNTPGEGRITDAQLAVMTNSQLLRQGMNRPGYQPQNNGEQYLINVSNNPQGK